MTLCVTKTKTAGLCIATSLLVLLNTACNKEETITPDTATTVTTDAISAADATRVAEDIDLTKAPDLFEDPVQPNPLAPQPDDVVVTVEGTDITYGEIMQGVQMTIMQLSRQMPQQQIEQMQKQIYDNTVDSLIANVLLAQAAAGSSLAVSEEEMAAEIATIQQGAPEGQTLEQTLADNGIDFAEWKENLRNQMLVGKLVEEKTANVGNASTEDVSTFYQENLNSFQAPESVSASHILIAFTEEDTDETKAEKKAKLVSISEQIAGGANFEELATANSDCPSSKKGGELGSFTRGQMVPTFEEVAFTIEPGSISDVVETQFGYHLIKVTDHQEAKTRSLDEVQEQLENYLNNQKKQEAVIAYINELRADADIEMHKLNLDGGGM